MVKALHESTRLVELDTPADAPSNRKNIQIITPGWGSSGYYSAEVLAEAAANKVIPAGTHMYLNHASETERNDRPERDVEKIAAVLVEDATWDGTRLIGPADLIGPHAELIESLAPYIGVSISGSATDVTIGEAEGRTGPIIEGLAHVSSVDFVTHAGRGGMVLLESARPSVVTARAVGHGVTEATANDTREQLQNQLRDTFGAEKTWIWVRDFDEDTVWFEQETSDASGTYGIAYQIADDGAVTLAGSPTEVRASTTYVPVTRPDSTIPTTEADQEVTMGNIQIEESVHNGLVEKAGRVDALESENATLKEAAASRVRTDRATAIVAERAKTAEVEFTALESRGLLAELPLKDGALDEATFTTTVDEAAATKKVAAGAGIVRGFGNDTTPAEESDEPIDLGKSLAESLPGFFPATQVQEA